MPLNPISPKPNPEPNNPAKAQDSNQSAGNKNQPTFILSEARYTLEDLILPQHTRNELQRAISLREHQAAVFQEWGFQNTHKYDNKMIINLYGEPGTGKTMAAHAIAARLNRPLLLVNYGDIESKYVGETPKNIQAAFEFAKQNHAILFFDEADAILSRRVTNMQSATDTSVNQTRSVMLTLLNDYNDTVLFATNFISNYDPAFMRRILMHIEFSLPDSDTRQKLFAQYIPKELPNTINIEKIAQEAEQLSGSDIANCVLLAAFAAKNDGKDQVSHEDLLDKIQAVQKSKAANSRKQPQLGKILKVEEKEVSEEFVQQQLNQEKLS